MLVRYYQTDDADRWDLFCAEAVNATFLHTRRYLGYHGKRFKDLSLILMDESENWLGLFPAAEDPGDITTIVSHPGITYGSVIHAGHLQGGRMLEALISIKNFYTCEGYRRLVYKAVPHIYHRRPAQDDLYALFRQGANRFRCDLSSTINLYQRWTKSSRRRRALRKAQKAGIRVNLGNPEHIPELWSVLRENLSRKHDATPVHTEGEFQKLAERFPEQIRLVIGWLDNDLVAGVVIYDTGNVHHAQYIASSEQGHAVNALDAVFEYCIESAYTGGVHWFDFGISNERQGMYLNDGLYKFKTEFGGGGVIHEFYEISLSEK